MRPTIVLVHGAFAESASWNGVIDPLQHAHHRVLAVANPLRGVASDAAALSDVVREIDGPVVLVGHSYGGAVITNVDPAAGEIVGLVYVAGFAPQPGETCAELSTMFPGSTLADTLEATPRADGTTDLTIAPGEFHMQFAADVAKFDAEHMAVTQRPITREALLEPSGERPLWREVPSYFVFGALDRNIPAAVQLFMAGRAGAQHTSELEGASHAVAVSRPTAVADVIKTAAALPAAA
jgi:pimeloyl-ACP methyl ester carboxylesterase